MSQTDKQVTDIDELIDFNTVDRQVLEGWIKNIAQRDHDIEKTKNSLRDEALKFKSENVTLHNQLNLIDLKLLINNNQTYKILAKRSWRRILLHLIFYTPLSILIAPLNNLKLSVFAIGYKIWTILYQKLKP